MEITKIIINGIEEDVPEDVLRLETWKQYRRKKIEFDKMPERTFVFKAKNQVRLPYPNLKMYCKNNNIKGAELTTVMAADAKLRKLQGTLSSLKQKSRIAPELSAGALRNPNYVLQQYESYILELYGRFLNPRQVHRKLVEEKINLNYTTVSHFFQVHKEKIREIRNRSKEEIDDLSVGIKRGRLEVLDFLLGDLRELYDNQTDYQKLQFSKEIRGIVDQARKEVEGDELKLTINGRIDINATIEGSMREDTILQDLTIIQIVISRVCARTGIPYMKLATRLSNSFYSKFNGFKKNTNLKEDPIYPSAFNYDIFEMKPRIDELYRVEDASYSVVEEALTEEKEQAGQIDKEKLRQLLGGNLNKLEQFKRKL